MSTAALLREGNVFMLLPESVWMVILCPFLPSTFSGHCTSSESAKGYTLSKVHVFSFMSAKNELWIIKILATDAKLGKHIEILCP